MFFNDWYGPLRILVVGPLAYFTLVILLRVSGNRTLSKMNAFDLVVTVALGSTLATALLTKQVPFLEGALALAVLIGLQFILTSLSVRSELVMRVVKGEPVLLVHRGRLLRGAMYRERVIEAEILQAVREMGLVSLDQVEAVVLETDGTFSVVEKSNGSDESSALRNVSGGSRASDGYTRQIDGSAPEEPAAR